MLAAYVKFVLSNAWFCHLFQIKEEHRRAADEGKEEEEEGETAEEEDEEDNVDEVGRG